MKKVYLNYYFCYSLQTNTFFIFMIFFLLSKTSLNYFLYIKKKIYKKKKQKTNKHKNTLSVCVKHFAQPPF